MNVAGASLLTLCATSLAGTQAWTQPNGALSKSPTRSGSGLQGGLSPAMGAPMGRGLTSNLPDLRQNQGAARLSPTALLGQAADEELSTDATASEAVKTQGTPDKIATECRELIASCKTLTFGLPSLDGEQTELSYAPFSFEDEPMTFYVLGSEIAGASRALIDAAHTGKPASVLLMSPEADTKQMYARKRLILQVKAEPVARGSKEWSEQVTKLQSRFGRIVDTLSAMPDFSMVALKPEKGRFIKGFGQAHDLVGKDLLHSKPAMGDHGSANKAA